MRVHNEAMYCDVSGCHVLEDWAATGSKCLQGDGGRQQTWKNKRRGEGEACSPGDMAVIVEQGGLLSMTEMSVEIFILPLSKRKYLLCMENCSEQNCFEIIVVPFSVTQVLSE